MTNDVTSGSSSEGKCCFKDQEGDVGEPILRQPDAITIRIMEARGHLHGDNRWDRGEQSGEDHQA